MKILVTGGSGFLGKRIVEELLANPDLVQPNLIRIMDIHPYQGKEDGRISYTRGDIRDYKQVEIACKGMDYVIHSASIVDWGNQSDEQVREINVGGTENVIRACRLHGVKGLIYTSSLDVVYSGKPLKDIDEQITYPKKYLTMYCESKYLAEKAVLQASSDKLLTCALRPSDVWGEQDPYHIESLIEVAQSGFYVRIGNGTSRCQHVYVGNCAYAHVQLLNAMISGNQNVSANAYFLTDGEASNFFKFFDPILLQAGIRLWPPNLWLPKPLAYFFAMISEGVALLMRPFKLYNPKFSRFAVTYTTTDFTFRADRAKADFNFRVKYSYEEACRRTVEYYRNEFLKI